MTAKVLIVNLQGHVCLKSFTTRMSTLGIIYEKRHERSWKTVQCFAGVLSLKCLHASSQGNGKTVAFIKLQLGLTEGLHSSEPAFGSLFYEGCIINKKHARK